MMSERKNLVRYIVINIADNEIMPLKSKAAVARYCNISINTVREGLVKGYIVRKAQEGESVPLFKL